MSAHRVLPLKQAPKVAAGEHASERRNALPPVIFPRKSGQGLRHTSFIFLWGAIVNGRVQAMTIVEADVALQG